jgi:hypothetical protein
MVEFVLEGRMEVYDTEIKNEEEEHIYSQVKNAIENWEKKKVMKFCEIDVNDEGEEGFFHPSGIDGYDGFRVLRKWADEAEDMIDLESVVVVEDITCKGKFLLLRQIGQRNSDGVAFVGDEWFPENAFHNPFFRGDIGIAKLQERYLELAKRAFFFAVAYEPRKEVLKIKRISEVPEDWECGICREGKDERPVLKLRCGGDHIFHSICAKEWGKTKVRRDEETTCPMCVRVVSSTASQEPESQQTPIGIDDDDDDDEEEEAE